MLKFFDYHTPTRSFVDVLYMVFWLCFVIQVVQAPLNQLVTLGVLFVFFALTPDPVEFHYWYKHRQEKKNEGSGKV